MRFKSEERRRGIFVFVCAIVFDLVVSFIAAKIFAQPDELWLTTVMVFLIIEGLSLAMIIKGAIWAAGAWWLYGKMAHADYIYGHLKGHQFPPALEYENSPGDYFRRLRDDPSQPLEVRLQAAAEHGAFDASSGSGIMKGVMLQMAYEAAIKRL